MKKIYIYFQAMFFFLSIIFNHQTSKGQTLTSSNLPLIIINTQGQQINDEPGIICTVKIINNASGINTPTDVANEYDGVAKIEYRGCSTQNFPKKPLGMELRSTTAVTTSIDVPLFGFPEESDWVLNPSYVDKSFMRDVLAFHMATVSGRYASRFRYVEIIINGSYQGIFIFEEKVKRDPGRINVNKMDPDDLGNNSITGGYVVKIDKSCGSNDLTHQWQSAHSSPGGTRNHYWATHYPNDNNLAPQQFTYIKDYITAFESMMASNTYCAGYSSYIDDDTFIDYILVEEASSNADAYRFSTFFSKERNSKGGKFSAGPVWDFNLAFGFLTSPFNGNTYSYEGWRYTAPGDSNFPVPFWWGKLLACPEFGAKFAARYKQLRQTVWSDVALTNFIDEQYATLNQGAFSRNFQKWNIIGTPTWGDQPAYNGATLVDEFNHLKWWLEKRLEWMDNAICAFTTLPTATLSAPQNLTINNGQSTELQLAFTGIAPWSYTLSSGQSGTATTSPTAITVNPTQSTTYTIQSIQNECGTGTGSGSVIITVLIPPADLVPTTALSPTVIYGNGTFSLVTDIININNGPTTSPVTIYIPKQDNLTLTFPPSVTFNMGKVVQNNHWTFDDSSDESYYILATNHPISANDLLAFTLNGSILPNGTSGTLSINLLIVNGSGGEIKANNNTNSVRVDYFSN